MLNPNQVYILDGALATELEAKGADLNDPLWSAKILLEQPNLIREVNLDYLNAGSDFVLTATYQATFEGLKKRGLSKNESIALFQKSVEIAKEARNEFWKKNESNQKRIKPLITASIGPYGAFLADGSEYRGNYDLTNNQLFDFHYERMKILAEVGTEIFAFETIPDLQEAKVLVEILKEFPKIKAWMSFSCRDDKHISDGNAFEQAVSEMNQHHQIFAVGMNCVPPYWVSELLKSAQKVTQKPFVVYPNGTGGWDAKNRCWKPMEEEVQIINLVKEWYDLGARIIGGCCRTTPKDIQEIRKKF